jgi:TorA maturation chaperone TorD
MDGIMQNLWVNKAALYELLAKSFLYLEKEIAEALVSGEYREALEELFEVNGLGAPSKRVEVEKLDAYLQSDATEVFHALRREQTRLFIGTKDPIIFPFAGAWDMLKNGQKPLLFVGKESMTIERFMRSCGIGQPEGTNEPLDHIGSVLEFLQHLCLVKAGVVIPAEGIVIPDTAYDEFYEKHFSVFSKEFAAKTIELSKENFLVVAAQALTALPEAPL